MCSQRPILSEEELAFRELLREVKELIKPVDELLENPVYIRRSRKTYSILTRNKQDAADLGQEVDLKVAQKFVARFTPDYERPFGLFFVWFRSVARNTYYDRLPKFRATKDQIMQAQKVLQDCGFYAEGQTGKLDENTLAALRKYQLAENLNVTRTLNKATVVKMGVDLTEQQARKPKFVDLEELFQLEDSGPGPEVLALRRELFEHIETLPPERRPALKLFLDGYSPRQVGDELRKLDLKYYSHVTIQKWVRAALEPFFSNTQVVFDWKSVRRDSAITRRPG